MDDAVLDERLDRARNGDVRAFTSLVREHDDAMRAVVWSVVQDPWVMDDVLQDAYEKAYRGLDRFRGESAFKTWLHRICWTTAVDAVRARSRERAREHGDGFDAQAELLAATGGTPEDRVLDRLTLQQAWAALSEDQRTAIALVQLNGLSYEEAATVCGTRPGTMAARVSRGRARLHDLLHAGEPDGGPR